MKKINSILILMIVMLSFFTQGSAKALADLDQSGHLLSELHLHQDQPANSPDIDQEHCHHDGSHRHHSRGTSGHTHHCHHHADFVFYFCKDVPNIPRLCFPKRISFNHQRNLYLSISLENELRPPIYTRSFSV